MNIINTAHERPCRASGGFPGFGQAFEMGYWYIPYKSNPAVPCKQLEIWHSISHHIEIFIIISSELSKVWPIEQQTKKEAVSLMEIATATIHILSLLCVLLQGGAGKGRKVLKADRTRGCTMI